MRRLLFATATALAGAAAVLSIAEAFARWRGGEPFEKPPERLAWAEPDEALGWRSREGVFPSDDPGNAPMTLWSRGRRATRAQPEPPAGAEFEVVFLGGSWFQGFGVRDAETYAWQLGERNPHIRYENYGTGGYGTYHSLLVLERELAAGAIDPDLVAYGFSTFHEMRNVSSWKWASGLRLRTGQRMATPHALLVDDQLERHPPFALPNWPGEEQSALVSALHDAWFRWTLRDRPAQQRDVTKRLLRRMNRVARRAGSGFVVVVIYGGSELDDYFVWLADEGIAAIDCRYPDDPWLPHLLVGGSGHPNATVHTYWADCFDRALERETARATPGAQ